MDIKRSGSVPSRRMGGGLVHRHGMAGPDHRGAGAGADQGRLGAFRAAARTAWHTHPLGQTLHVVSGIGRVQLWGGPMREIRAGDTVWIAPGEKHWHGAGPDTAMVHIALQEHSTASTSPGWSTSPTSSTAARPHSAGATPIQSQP